MAPGAFYDNASLGSQPLQFLVGKESQKFYLHPQFVAKHSAKLDKLMHIEMRETPKDSSEPKDFSELEEVDPATFARFGEYIYTGDYEAADPSILPDASSSKDIDRPSLPEISTSEALKDAVDPSEEGYQPAVIDEPEPDPWEFGYGRTSVSKKTKKGKMQQEVPILSKQQEAWDQFKSTKYDVDLKSPVTAARINTEYEEYKEVFLSHVRIYDFATFYKIENLRRLALHKLHETLVTFTLYDERVGDVVELLRYAYTPRYRHGSSEYGDVELDMNDDLCKLVISYVSCKIQTIKGNSAMEQVERDLPSASVDLIKQLISRLDT